MTRIRRPSAATLKILNSLAAAPKGLHGYALMQASSLASGTLYPILKRLTDRGWLEKNWESGEDEAGPPRRIYRLTPLGRQQLQSYADSENQKALSKTQGSLA